MLKIKRQKSYYHDGLKTHKTREKPFTLEFQAKSKTIVKEEKNILEGGGETSSLPREHIGRQHHKKISNTEKSVKKRVVKQKVSEKMLNLIRSRQNWLLGL